MNQGSPSPDAPENCHPDTIYKFASDQAILRTQLQHKCVEISLQITTGLAVGAFAVMFRELSNSAHPSTFISTFSLPVSKLCLVIVIELYTILQLLILANYLYHTFMTIISGLPAQAISQTHINAIRKSLLNTLPSPNPRQKRDASILLRFQPLIIYFSAGAGILTGLGSAVWLFFPPLGSGLRYLLVIIPVPLFYALYKMYRFHKDLDKLAKSRTWTDLKREEEAPSEHQSAT